MDFHDKIFACSDESDMCSRIADRFGDKVFFYHSLKSPNAIPLHMPFHIPGRQNDPEYQCRIAEDVIVESHLLSKTNFLICSTGSNVNYLSRALNPELECITLMDKV